MDTIQSKAPKSAPVADFVQYANDSIVSKQLMNRKGGTISLFAFDAGQSLSEHTAPFDAYVEVLDGIAEVLIDRCQHTVRRGEFIVLPSNVPHALNAVERFKMLLVMIKN